MKLKFRTRHILNVVLLLICITGLLSVDSSAAENSKYLEAVREFADNVLKKTATTDPKARSLRLHLLGHWFFGHMHWHTESQQMNFMREMVRSIQSRVTNSI